MTEAGSSFKIVQDQEPHLVEKVQGLCDEEDSCSSYSSCPPVIMPAIDIFGPVCVFQ
jgi:hypothetical protein